MVYFEEAALERIGHVRKRCSGLEYLYSFVGSPSLLSRSLLMED